MDLDIQIRAAKIFQSLIELPAAERPDALAAACGGDAALAAEVEALLALDEDEGASAMFELSAAATAPAVKAALLAPGQELGRYVVEKRLGVGGMAEVWAARHQTLGTWHAVKVLLWASAPLQQRLLREGRAQGRLVHPNILPVRDILDLAGTPALLMPLVEGPSLDRLLQERPLGTGEALSLFRGILDGVGHAHDAGVIHRDIKPANVLIDLRRGALTPLVADFGLVKELGGTAHTVAGTVMGTPAYAAPEQLADASAVDHRADIFSLGVVLVELLTRTRPFPGGSLAEIIDSHHRPPRLGGVPEALRPLAAAMLSVDPARRPASCAAVAARLPAAAGTTDLDSLTRAVRDQLSPQPPLPPPTTVVTPNNLPQSRDRFVGRGDELGALAEKLEGGVRLLTVVGAGGAGKTRLCLEAARAMLPAWSGGVWWADLHKCRTLEDALVATSGALQRPQMSPSVAAITDLLAGMGRCLIVLDNFEQLAEDAAAAVAAWLDALPEVAFLVTSRQPLRLRGEHLLPLSPLDAEAGAALFVARAQAISPGYAIAEDEHDALADLVSMLDGLPLAIELAAARARLMRPGRLLSRLGRRFDLLTSRSQDLPERQRTLRATLEWSWELLSEAERSALAQCSVFEGGFTPEAAEAVVDLSGLDEDVWVEDVIAELVDRSLLVSAEHRDARQTRLSMLVSVQAFAREKLPADSPARQRHCAWFAQLGERAALEALDRLQGAPEFFAFLLEIGNVSAAARWALDHGEQRIACRAIFALQQQTFARGPLSLARELLDDAIARWAGPPDDDYAHLLWCRGVIRSIHGDEAAALALYARCLEVPGVEPFTEVRAQASSGYLLSLLQRHDESEAHFAAGLALTEVPGSSAASFRGRLLDMLAGSRRRAGRFDESLRLFEEALAFLRQHREPIDSTLNNFGLACYAAGQSERGAQNLREGLAQARRNKSTRVESIILRNLAARTRDPMQALEWCRQAMAQSQRVGGLRGQLQSRSTLVQACIKAGLLDEAREHMAPHVELTQRSGQEIRIVEARVLQAWLSSLSEPPARAQARIAAWLDETDSPQFRHEASRLRVTLAQLSLDAGDPPAAIPPLRQALEDFRSLKADFYVTECQILLWEALARSGSPEAGAARAAVRIGSHYQQVELEALLLCSEAAVARHRQDPAALQRARAALDQLIAAQPCPLSYPLARRIEAVLR